MNAIARFLSRNWAIIGIIVAWQAWISVSQLNSIVIAGPWPVLKDILTNPALYLVNTVQTLATAAAGLVIGLVVGITLAVLAWSSRFLQGLLTPFGMIFSSVPIAALIPIVARILGYDISTVVAIVAISAFFPTFVFVGKGLNDLPRGTSDLMAVMGASKLARFRHLVLPAAVPDMMIALRIVVPESVLAAILAEFLMGRSGLGFVFRDSVSRFIMERALGTSIVVAIAAILCFFLAQRAERAVKARWS